MEHAPDHPENGTRFDLEVEMRDAVAQAGGVAGFLQARHAERTAPPEDGTYDAHRSTLLQMERIARAVSLPHEIGKLPGSDARGAGFYWGEILAMELGDLVFDSHDWAGYLYLRLSRFQRENLELARNEQTEPAIVVPDAPGNLSRDGERAILAANLMIGDLEYDPEDESITEELMDLGREYAAQLSGDAETRRYIEFGFTLVMRNFERLADRMVRADREYSLIDEYEKELAGMPQWDDIARELDQG